MSKTLKVSFIIPADLLPTITSVLMPEVSTFTIEEVGRPSVTQRTKPAAPAIKGSRSGTPVGRSAIARTVINELETGSKTTADLSKAFTHVGFSVESVGTAIRMLIAADMIVREGQRRHAVYSLKRVVEGGSSS